MNKIKNRKTTEKINEAKNWFSENKTKINKSLARLTQNRRERTYITNVRNVRPHQKNNREILRATLWM